MHDAIEKNDPFNFVCDQHDAPSPPNFNDGTAKTRDLIPVRAKKTLLLILPALSMTPHPPPNFNVVCHEQGWLRENKKRSFLYPAPLFMTVNIEIGGRVGRNAQRRQN